MTEMQCALRGANNERVALSDVSVRATLRNLLSEVTVTQTYRNTEEKNIEAVYTFPLPLDAVLLDFDVRLGERVLRGMIVEKKQAEKQYEDAVASGDSAVMLEMLEPGLYTMNVGNLLAGETAIITVRYALVYRWSGDALRVMIPTTVAPRYGASTHQPHRRRRRRSSSRTSFRSSSRSSEVCVMRNCIHRRTPCNSRPAKID